MDPISRPHVVLEHGADHSVYGEYVLGAKQGLVWGISVGADQQSPSRRFKGDQEVPNEDGLLVVDDGQRCLMAVADAHFGAEASHDLLLALAVALDAGQIPTSPAALADLVRGLEPDQAAEYASETTLLVAVHDRTAERGFGISFGDSSLAVLGSRGIRMAGLGQPVRFVSPAQPGSLDPDEVAFEFTAQPGELLIAFTDGIDGCHYNHPETSVTPAIMASLFAETGPDAERYARALIELALAGVDGNPGGQDNIALIVLPA